MVQKHYGSMLKIIAQLVFHLKPLDEMRDLIVINYTTMHNRISIDF